MLNLTGHAVFEITDPLGRHMSYDADSSLYVSDIPYSLADQGTIWDTQDSTASTPSSDRIEIPAALDGSYRIEVVGQADGWFGMSLSDYDTGGGLTGWSGTGTTSPGSSAVYIAEFSSQPGVPIQVHEPAGVREPDVVNGLNRLTLRAPNPYRAGEAMTMWVPEPGFGVIAVYDVQGREVQVLWADRVGAGRLEVRWDGEMKTGQQAPAGVYYAAARVGHWRAQRPLILLR